MKYGRIGIQKCMTNYPKININRTSATILIDRSYFTISPYTTILSIEYLNRITVKLGSLWSLLSFMLAFQAKNNDSWLLVGILRKLFATYPKYHNRCGQRTWLLTIQSLWNKLHNVVCIMFIMQNNKLMF